MASTSTQSAVREVLREAMASDEAVVVLGESVGRMGGVAGTTDGLLDAFGPDRVMDLPVADRAVVALAVGLALGGRRPVVELSATGRLLGALEALAEAASVAADGEFAVPLVLRVPYGGEAGARVDRPLADALAAIPGLRVVCPSSPANAAGLLRAALQARGPVVLLEPRALYEERGTTGDDPVPLDRLQRLREGEHVTLAAFGMGVDAARTAADSLAAEGISAEVLDLVSLAPVDPALGEAVRRTGRLVVVHPGEEGLAERLLRVGLHHAFLHLESPLAAAAADPDTVARAARDAVFY